MRRGTQFEADAFRRIFETSPIGIMVLAADHGRVLVNDAFCAMLGYTRDELLAVAPQVELNHPDDLPNAQASLDALVAGERGVYVRRTRYRHREGHYVWVEVSVAIMVDEDDEDHQFIVQARDITTTLDQEQQLQRLADHDDLTTLLNRRVFDQRLRLHASAVQLGRRRAQGSVLVIDLDNFKHHNDAYGHAVGDAILVGVAWALRERLREHDVIGRLGGDEFAVLLPDAAGADAEAVAGSLLHRISETAAAISPDSSHPVTASIGIADFLIDRDADAVMLEADRALYDAKSAGRNRWARHAGLVEPAGAAGATRAAIGQYAIVRDVITQELVTVVCQPFVDYATSRVVGWETLARASHPVHGPIPPVDLVRLATRHDLIDDLTRQVIDQGLNAATAAAGLVNGPITVTANIELTQIRRHSDLIDWLLARELPTGATLLLEITERGGDDWTREHESVAHRLAVRGIQLGLDDYGTGYSRLSFLRARTWDLIKLDQRFLQTRTARDRDVVAAFVELVHGSGIQTLAEGIETEEQHGWARSVGIGLGQGYLYGKPVPADVLLALLAERGLRVPAQR